MKRSRWWCFFLLLFLLTACGSGATGSSPIAATPSPTDTPTPTVAPTPTIPNMPAQAVHFMTSDNVQLAGLLYGHGKTFVICSHMLGTTKQIWSESGLPQRLALLGYSVLIYDFRGSGDSQPPKNTWVLDVDLRAAVNFASQQGAKSIVLMGASMGGTASLKVAAEQQVTAVISLSGPQSFTISVSDDEVRGIKAAKLFIASDSDAPFSDDARHMYAIASEPRELHIYPGDEHGTDIFGGDNGDGPAQLILHFLAQYAPAS